MFHLEILDSAFNWVSSATRGSGVLLSFVIHQGLFRVGIMHEAGCRLSP